jgi:hypothetical protein
MVGELKCGGRYKRAVEGDRDAEVEHKQEHTKERDHEFTDNGVDD